MSGRPNDTASTPAFARASVETLTAETDGGPRPTVTAGPLASAATAARKPPTT